MSSIIDALKKSDAKRPKKNPGLNIGMDLNNQSSKKTRWGFYAVIGFLIVVLMAVYFQEPDFVWQHLGSAEQPTVSADNSPKKATQLTQPTKKLKKPAPDEVQSVAKQQSTQKPTDQEPSQNKTTTPQKSQPQVVQDNQKQTATQTNSQPDQNSLKSNQTEPQVQQQIDQQLAATPMKNKQAINKPVEDKQEPKQTENTLPQLFELPYSIRKEVPKMNLSVHVYDPLVENRMAILNGVPVHVGDTLEDIITIQDITQSGVVLRIQNRDFIVLK